MQVAFFRGELVDDLVNKTEVVGYNSIKTTLICTSTELKLLKLTGQFDLFDVGQALGFAHSERRKDWWGVLPLTTSIVYQLPVPHKGSGS